jgi:Hint domain-containing protein
VQRGAQSEGPAMTAPSNSFTFMYELQSVNGAFVLKDFDNSTGDGLTPIDIGTGLSVNDDIADSAFPGPDNPTILGDTIGGDRFDLTVQGGPLASVLSGEYSFVSLALTSDSTGPTDTGHLGFIAQAGTNYYYITNNQITIPASASASELTLTTENGDVGICFMQGTQICTPTGEVSVENLKIGDLVRTSDGHSIAVRWIGRQTVAGRFADELRLPIRIRAGALGDNVPSRDLCVSPDHALLVDDVLIHVGALVNGTSIVRERPGPVIFTYYHVEVDDHSLILAENTPAETFVDNVDRARFDNWQEYQALYPKGRCVTEMPYPRAKALRQVPRAIRERLSERGIALSGLRSVLAA